MSLVVAGAASVIHDWPRDKMDAQNEDVAPAPGSASAPVASAVPDAPQPDDLSAVAGGDLASTSLPQTGGAPGLAGPAPEGDDTAALSQDAPVTPNATVSTPAAPVIESELSISTDPAQPPAPVIEDAQSGLGVASAPVQPTAPQEPAVADETLATESETAARLQAEATAAVDAADLAATAAAQAAQAAGEEESLGASFPSDDLASAVAAAAAKAQSEAEAQSARVAAQEAQAAEEARAAEDARAATEAQAARAAEAQAAAEALEAERQRAEAEALEQAQAEAEAQAAEAAPADPDPSQTEATDARPSTAELPVVGAPPQTLPEAQPSVEVAEPLRPAIGTPVDSLSDLANGVRTNRLPTTRPTADEGAPQAPAAAPADPGQSPLALHAVPFENPDDKPLMSIVLIDAGQDLSGETIGLEALGSFPYPISFAVDATLPDAAERMARYRAEGFEVLAVLDLPEGATATDAEVSVATALAKLPEAVAILEGVKTGVQSTREAADQVSAILAATGHGFVTQNRGLNTVQKLAARNGVPSAIVFRDFDGEDQTPSVIRRFLDQAAFRARQEGAVIMMGRLREDTISALLVWGLQDRASQVALAPVSAVLSRPE